ncbi:MAG: hypothetical protein JRN38_07580, partial [Nitrososphaerota archaeon]|nr:hypothetical protein [Nitrososphaerota archaeon]
SYQPGLARATLRVRPIIELARFLVKDLPAIRNPDEAFLESLRKVIVQEKEHAEDTFASMGADPRQVLKEWRVIVAKGIDEKGGRSRLVGFRPYSKTSLSLRNSSDRFLRESIRSGVLFSPDPWMPDELSSEFIISSFLSTDDAIAFRDGLRNFDGEVSYSPVHFKQIDRWARPRAGGRRKQEMKLRSIFLSHWQSKPSEPERLLAALKSEGVTRFANIVVGKPHGSPQFSEDIFDRVKESDMVVADVSTPRRDIFVEVGWAIARFIPVLFVTEKNSGHSNVPDWLSERQIQRWTSPEGMASIVKYIGTTLDALPGTGSSAMRIQTWRLAAHNLDNMDRIPDPKKVAVFHPLSMKQQLGRLKTTASELNMDFDPIETDARKPSLLYECIITAREAGTAVVVFDGTDGDFLGCVAAGLISARRQAKSAGTTYNRDLYLISLTERNGILPSLVSRRFGTVIPNDLDDLNSKLHEHLNVLNRTVISRKR